MHAKQLFVAAAWPQILKTIRGSIIFLQNKSSVTKGCKTKQFRFQVQVLATVVTELTLCVQFSNLLSDKDVSRLR